MQLGYDLSLSIPFTRSGLSAAVAALFASGEQGAWYDESDLTTLFQDSAGATPVTAVEQPVGKMNDKSGRGNHATQATAAARPVLSALVNLLTKTEQFADAAWGLFSGATLVGVAPVAAPNGSAAYEIAFGATGGAVGGASAIYYTPSVITNATSTIRFFVRAKTGSTTVRISACATGSSDQTVGTEWVLLSLDVPAGDLNTALRNNVAGNSANVYVAQAQTNYGGLAIPYQRVNTATDYDTAGFPKYAKTDGIDDSMSTTAGGGGTAGFFFCQAIKPTGGAGALRTIWSDTALNSGYRVRVNTANQLELAAGNGTPLTPSVANAPTTSTTGGTLAAATYFYVITALNAKGESLKSNEVSVATTGTTSSNTVTWGAVTDATSYRIYRGTATGAQNVFYAVGNVLTYLDTGAANTAGTPPTITDTAFTKLSSTATVDVGTTSLITVWDDGTNLNVQIGSAAAQTAARPVVTAGTAALTLGKDNGAATGFFTGNLYPEVYRQGSGLTAGQRTSVQTYCKSKAGL